MRKILLVLVAVFMLYGISSVQDSNKKLREHVWTKEDSKAYARDAVIKWADKQYVCLEKLWDRESRWNHDAYNSRKVMGKNAGGIPQLLGMSPTVPPTNQIDRGLEYIVFRYGTPCKAWEFHQRRGWY